jgi:hypothetical protein
MLLNEGERESWKLVMDLVLEMECLELANRTTFDGKHRNIK